MSFNIDWESLPNDVISNLIVARGTESPRRGWNAFTEEEFAKFNATQRLRRFDYYGKICQTTTFTFESEKDYMFFLLRWS